MKKKFLFAAFLICGAISSVAEEKPKYKDASLPVEERVEDLLRRMTLHEKVLQLQNNSTSDINAIENTYKGGSPGSVHEMSKSAKEAALLFNKMQEYLLTQNRLGIPALVTVEGINGVTQNGCTIFPQAIAQGSTFNPELVEEMSRAIGRESHVIGIRQLQCPVLDIARDLRWGRVEETFGEDPFLIGEMGTAFVRGSQAEGVEREQSYKYEQHQKYFFIFQEHGVLIRMLFPAPDIDRDTYGDKHRCHKQIVQTSSVNEPKPIGRP